MPAPTAYDIPAYLDFLSPELLARLDAEAEPVPAVEGLRIAPGLRDAFPDLLTDEALAFVCAVYEATRGQLRELLAQRAADRAFIDAATRAAVAQNRELDYKSPEYATALGLRDDRGRVVVGPTAPPQTLERVEIPACLQGPQITLFGPPDTARLSINAMNALHRRLPQEPARVAALVEASGIVPRWGADSEDSKTPLMQDLLLACQNLPGCLDGTLRFEDTARQRVYTLAPDGRSTPIKRVAGLAIPDGHHLLRGNPLPLHLVDFALHAFHSRARPEGLLFYIPKLENEEEAAYLKALFTAAEERLAALEPSYTPGTIKAILVFESPRAIFRIQAMAQALHPHFVGGSLGWHDFLGSTARLFREDPRYRIPVKADPNIVIHHIRESHGILVRELTPLGALRIGGMYGVLYEDGNPASFQTSMVGYIKDVTTQLKRGLDGFWVAHPDFVRLGIALWEAWRRHAEDGDASDLRGLITDLIPDPVEHEPLLSFVFGPDIEGLAADDPRYPRGVLAATIGPGEAFIANDDPEEVRYNVFQALQYLADWLRGNGCVALPATLTDARGERVFVRVMDDLATTERSRWEVWAEVRHGRVSLARFEAILQEEIAFIQADATSDTRRVQVPWRGEAARWYPIAVRLLRQLMTDPQPVEFATELLLPFTLAPVRDAADPWAAAQALCPGRYRGEAP